jgi:DNA-3-methyladenine glycosylase II
MSRILNVDVDLRPFYETVRDDRFLLEATHGLYGLHPPQTPSVFEALVMAVVGQQISGLVARAIRARVVRELGTPFVVDGDTVHAFPQPLAFLRAGEERLRGLGLSGRKAEYILDIASRADDQPSFFDRLRKVTNQEVVEELTRIRGVGQWTAQWVLLGALGRTDAFPAGDLALRSLLSEAYFGGRSIHEKEALEFAGKQWGDYAGLATTYLFAYIRRRRMENERRDIVQGA